MDAFAPAQEGQANVSNAKYASTWLAQAASYPAGITSKLNKATVTAYATFVRSESPRETIGLKSLKPGVSVFDIDFEIFGMQ